MSVSDKKKRKVFLDGFGGHIYSYQLEICRFIFMIPVLWPRATVTRPSCIRPPQYQPFTSKSLILFFNETMCLIITSFYYFVKFINALVFFLIVRCEFCLVFVFIWFRLGDCPQGPVVLIDAFGTFNDFDDLFAFIHLCKNWNVFLLHYTSFFSSFPHIIYLIYCQCLFA